MYNPFSLSGKHILITGASSGIGRAIAVVCSKLGATLYLVARNMSRLQETLALMDGEQHKCIVEDLSIVGNICKLVDVLPPLDGIVHNVGVGSRIPCKFIHEKDINVVFDLNTRLPILLQSEILSRKLLNKKASVIFMASKAADYPSVGNAIYSASKGAIISYSKVLALELANRDIRVNCICPAMIWTDLITKDGISKEELEIAQLKYPLRRYGTPDDIAYLAVYLLSDVSSWMTGSCIDITGGAKEL